MNMQVALDALRWVLTGVNVTCNTASIRAISSPCLRSNVRKEKKKYEQSLKSGASADDVYRNKLWYYDMFNFIHD